MGSGHYCDGDFLAVKTSGGGHSERDGDPKNLRRSSTFSSAFGVAFRLRAPSAVKPRS